MQGQYTSPFEEVNSLSHKIVGCWGGTLLRFEEGAFSNLYGSVVPTTTKRRVCFFLHRRQDELLYGKTSALAKTNHFFTVLFDYGTHRAYAFGTSCVSESEVRISMGLESRWNSWQGPGLWEMIGMELGWVGDVGDSATVTVVIKNWAQVCHSPGHILKETAKQFPRRMALTVECIRW